MKLPNLMKTLIWLNQKNILELFLLYPVLLKLESIIIEVSILGLKEDDWVISSRREIQKGSSFCAFRKKGLCFVDDLDLRRTNSGCTRLTAILLFHFTIYINKCQNHLIIIKTIEENFWIKWYSWYRNTKKTWILQIVFREYKLDSFLHFSIIS